MKFPEIPQKYCNLANKIWQKAQQPISFVLSIMTKKFTPAAISVGLAFLLIEKTYSIISGYVKLVLEKEVTVAASSVVLTAFVLLLVAIFAYTAINWSILYIAKFFRGQIAEIKIMWQLSKMIPLVSSEISNHNNYSLINYDQAIWEIRHSTYGLRKKYDAINNGVIAQIAKPLKTIGDLFSGMTLEQQLMNNRENLIYDAILQEFVKKEGFLDKDFNTKNDILYQKTSIKINKDVLDKFLREKELEIQTGENII